MRVIKMAYDSGERFALNEINPMPSLESCLGFCVVADFLVVESPESKGTGDTEKRKIIV